MRHAVKMPLAAESDRFNINERRHVEYRDLGKDPARLAKADLSIEMSEILREQLIPDDVKYKLYNHALQHFLNIAPRVSSVQQESVPIVPLDVVIKKPIKKDPAPPMPPPTPPKAVCRSKRKAVPPIEWVEWPAAKVKRVV